jgi:hypothetical protein
MRDELGDQVRDSVRKAFRSQESPQSGDVWATATTEPPHAADQPPECAWCPICRAARRMAEARAENSGGSTAAASPGLSDIADAMTAAARGALAGIDSMLSYRPPGQPGTASGRAREPEDEPDDRG